MDQQNKRLYFSLISLGLAVALSFSGVVVVMVADSDGDGLDDSIKSTYSWNGSVANRFFE